VASAPDVFEEDNKKGYQLQLGHPGLLFGLALFSYFVGHAVILCSLALLECMYYLMNRMTPSWSWRGNAVSRWKKSLLLPYHWGFFACYGATAATLYLFNRHREYVPPFSPLNLLGVIVGLFRFMVTYLSAPSFNHNYHKWAQQCALEIKAHLTSWCCGAASRDQRCLLLRRWKELNGRTSVRMSMKCITTMLINA